MSRLFEIDISNRVACVETSSKKKILGMERYRIMMRNKIQPRDRRKNGGPDSMGGIVVTGGALYITDSNGNPNVFNVKRNSDGSWLNANNANPDNRWNADNQFVFVSRYSFLSPLLCGGVLFI